MSSIEVTSESTRELFNDLNKLNIVAPRSVYTALKSIANAMKNMAQDKLKADGHIVTARLRNSITTYSKDRNTHSYRDNKGGSYSEKSPIPLKKQEVAVGTNVNYAGNIERIDSFIGYAVNNISNSSEMDTILKNTAKQIEREMNK